MVLPVQEVATILVVYFTGVRSGRAELGPWNDASFLLLVHYVTLDSYLTSVSEFSHTK